MPHLADPLSQALAVIFVVAQLLYLLSFAIDGYLYALPVNWVEPRQGPFPMPAAPPHIVLFYPVLREREEVMRTTFTALARMDYPADRFEVVAVPNSHDAATVAALERLRGEFPFLQILQTPPTSDARWRVVWDAWEATPKAYWWHAGRFAGRRDLPPKKTRQLIYAFYTVSAARGGGEDFLVDYIDADSAPPADHFQAAAHGMRSFDVLQAQNVAGNLNRSVAAALHSLDHMIWDGGKYAHMSADGRQPYWVLGKGLFFRASDLLRLGGFHPWIAIEDPEVGMRFWADGLRLGIIEPPLIEETPETFGFGITQRKRWVCGFFQSLSAPLGHMGFTPRQKIKAWMNFLPCLMLGVNVIGAPTGLWALASLLMHRNPLPTWTWGLSGLNVVLLGLALVRIYAKAWTRSALVLDTRRARLAYMLRVNPAFILAYWCLWCVPLAMGFWMWVRDGGLVWERTYKTNANEALVVGRTEPATDAFVTPLPEPAAHRRRA